MIEQFLGDNVKFATMSECMNFIKHCIDDAETKSDKIDLKLFRSDLSGTFNCDPSGKALADIHAHIYDDTYARIIAHCGFSLTIADRNHIKTIIYNMSYKKIILLYYRNNLYEFLKVPAIAQLIRTAIDPLSNLELCDYDSISDPDAKEATKYFTELLCLYVHNDYPVYDRVRKAMYTDKTNSLYTDTDSVFLSMYKLVRYMQSDILAPKSIPQMDYDVMLMNFALIFINEIVDRALKSLCRFMNVDDEIAKALAMKNEFIIGRIMFVMKKKRYLSMALYQEGVKLFDNDDLIGLPEIKGFDFMKSTTKIFIRDTYESIIKEDILRAEDINLVTIFRKLIGLKQDIEQSMQRGESKYYKQANIQVKEHYKVPYSNQGYVSIQVWNAVCPQYAVELPSDVDIVPIIDLTYKKPAPPKDGSAPKKNALMKDPREVNRNIAMIAEKYPDLYQNLSKNIYSSPNPMIRHMSIRFIAKPKNDLITLPPWFPEIMNTEKITNDALGLFLPIAKCLGLNSLHTTKSKEHLSNLVHL